MEKIPHQIIITTLLLLSSLTDSFTRTQIGYEGSGLGGLGLAIEFYSAYNESKLPSSWNDILTMDDSFYYRYDQLTRPITDGQNVTERYSFISSEERKKFPEGELVLVSYLPRPRIDGREGPGWRTLIYRNQRGRIVSASWDEERFQAMLMETGITILPPEPLPPEPPLPVDNQQQQPQPEAPGMESVEEQPTHPDAIRIPGPSADQPQESASEEETEDDGNRILFLLTGGILVLMLAITWCLLKRKITSA